MAEDELVEQYVRGQNDGQGDKRAWLAFRGELITPPTVYNWYYKDIKVIATVEINA